MLKSMIWGHMTASPLILIDLWCAFDAVVNVNVLSRLVGLHTASTIAVLSVGMWHRSRRTTTNLSSPRHTLWFTLALQTNTQHKLTVTHTEQEHTVKAHGECTLYRRHLYNWAMCAYWAIQLHLRSMRPLNSMESILYYNHYSVYWDLQKSLYN